MLLLAALQLVCWPLPVVRTPPIEDLTRAKQRYRGQERPPHTRCGHTVSHMHQRAEWRPAGVSSQCPGRGGTLHMGRERGGPCLAGCGCDAASIGT